MRSPVHGVRKQVHMRFHYSVSSESVQTVCVKLNLIIEATSCDSVKRFLSHPRGFFTSVPQVLLVKNRFISRGPELFISFPRVICRGHVIFIFPKRHQGLHNLHIHTISVDVWNYRALENVFNTPSNWFIFYISFFLLYLHPPLPCFGTCVQQSLSQFVFEADRDSGLTYSDRVLVSCYTVTIKTV